MADPDAKYRRDEEMARRLYGDRLPAGRGKNFANALRKAMAADVAAYDLAPDSAVVIDEEGTVSILTAAPASWFARVLDVRSDVAVDRQIELLRLLSLSRPLLQAGALPAQPDLVARWAARDPSVAQGEADQAPTATMPEPRHGVVLAVRTAGFSRQYSPLQIAASVPGVSRVGVPHKGSTRWIEPGSASREVQRVPEVHVHLQPPAGAALEITEAVVVRLAAQGMPLHRLVADLGGPSGEPTSLDSEERALLEEVLGGSAAGAPAAPPAGPSVPAGRTGGTAVSRSAAPGAGRALH